MGLLIKGHLGCVGCGGLFRDHTGKWLGGFAMNIW